jgi:hypothetical protein
MSDNKVIKLKDLFAPVPEKKKPKKRAIRIPPGKKDWWKEHGSWAVINKIMEEK